jgi:hypothetical protein
VHGGPYFPGSGRQKARRSGAEPSAVGSAYHITGLAINNGAALALALAIAIIYLSLSCTIICSIYIQHGQRAVQRPAGSKVKRIPMAANGIVSF